MHARNRPRVPGTGCIQTRSALTLAVPAGTRHAAVLAVRKRFKLKSCTRNGVRPVDVNDKRTRCTGDTVTRIRATSCPVKMLPRRRLPIERRKRVGWPAFVPPTTRTESR